MLKIYLTTITQLTAHHVTHSIAKTSPKIHKQTF